MSKYRKVDPRIWNDQRFRELSDAGKLAFLFLLTHPHMTSVGAMRATMSGLAEELGWGPEAFRKAFAEALSKGMAKHDPKACFVGLPKFTKYNRPESANVVRGWAKAWDLVPECSLKNELYQCLKDNLKGFDEGFMKAFTEAFPQPSLNQEQEQEPKQEQDKPPAANASASAHWLEESLWTNGLQVIARLSGKKPERIRSVIGKWRKSHADEKVLYAIARAEKETASDPVAFVEGILRAGGKGNSTESATERSIREAREYRDRLEAANG